jgi:hypothetical protein
LVCFALYSFRIWKHTRSVASKLVHAVRDCANGTRPGVLMRRVIYDIWMQFRAALRRKGKCSSRVRRQVKLRLARTIQTFIYDCWEINLIMVLWCARLNFLSSRALRVSHSKLCVNSLVRNEKNCSVNFSLLAFCFRPYPDRSGVPFAFMTNYCTVN